MRAATGRELPGLTGAPGGRADDQLRDDPLVAQPRAGCRSVPGPAVGQLAVVVGLARNLFGLGVAQQDERAVVADSAHGESILRAPRPHHRQVSDRRMRTRGRRRSYAHTVDDAPGTGARPVGRRRRRRDRSTAPGSTRRSAGSGRCATAAPTPTWCRSPVPDGWDVDLYLKDESTHPTGSLKHRLARSLFLYAICNGEIGPGTTVTEASSGSTAVSEAYFARMLGLPFVAVMAAHDQPEKIALIEREGGTLPSRRRPGRRLRHGAGLADATSAATTSTSSPTPSGPPTGGATTTSPSRSSPRWRSSGIRCRSWVVVGAGTGGTSATIGRYVRYRGLPTKVARRRPRELRLPHGVPGPADRWRARVADRGHRPAPRGAELRAAASSTG